jgi:hypothetical protein
MANETARLLAAPPVTEKKLLELSVTWPGLRGGRARMAEALRTFVITWDPLETRVPRPDGFANVNVGSLGLEIAIYLPCWRLAELAAAGHQTIADVISALTGSAVLTAAEHAEDVLAGWYTNLVAAGQAPDLLANPAGGTALGVPRIQADPQCWDDIGLGAMTDIAEHAFGQVDLDRSRVELAVLPSRQPGCPACAGRRFGFIADLSEAQESMCPAHRAEADAVTRGGWPGRTAATRRGGRRWSTRRSGGSCRTCPTVWRLSWPGPSRRCTSSRNETNWPSAPGWWSKRPTGSPATPATSGSRSARTRT